MAHNNNKYSFVSIFKKGVYDTKQNVAYYIYIPNDIVIPIKNNEKETIHMNFKLFKEYALLEVYLADQLILKQCIEVYNKETFDIDLVIDIFK